MKLNEFNIVETDHFKERSQERNINVQEILYGLRDRITELRGYRNLNKELAYIGNSFSVIFDIHGNNIVFKTVLDQKTNKIYDAIVM
ncbi:MAG: hypothetical protein ACOCT9_01605 [archaeon]